VVQEYWDNAAPGKPSPLPTDGSVITGPQLPSSSQPSPTLKALFDSTHFADVSPITIKLKVTDSNSGYYEATVAGPAYNKALLLESNVLDVDYMGGIANELASPLRSTANYTAIASNSYQKMDILNALPANTAFFIFSHGLPGTFGDCDALDTSSSYFRLYAGTSAGGNDSVNQPTVSQEILNKGNSPPPYNFVLSDCCLTGYDSQLANAFLGSNGSKTDRAYVGYTVEVWGDSSLHTYTNALWTNLLSGKTLRDAIIDADCTSTPVNGAAPDGLLHPDNENPVAVPKYYGDASMRLHYVYGGHTQFNGIFSTEQWFRGI
jgi:hypothetical protein